MIQAVRVIDVLILGPAMIYAATQLPKNGFLSAFLAISGACTVVFNGINYIAVHNATRGTK
jgi:hypothetical protein